MKQSAFACFLCLCATAFGLPARAPTYSPQYQPIQYETGQQPYLQQLTASQPQYITSNIESQDSTPIFEGPQRSQAPQRYVSQQPTQRIQPLLLPTNVDRQIQKVAQQTAGPYYVQQVQATQQQAQAEEAAAVAQRRAQTAAIRAQQQYQAAVQAAQPQYLREVPQAYNTKALIRPSNIPQNLKGPIPTSLRQQEPEQEEEFDTNTSYQFGFDVKDDLYTNYQNRKEQREGGKITGSYSVVDSDGFIRTVTYTADPKEGFKAEVVRQPTDIVVKIPTPAPVAKPQQHYIEEVPAPRLQQGQKQNVIYQYQ